VLVWDEPVAAEGPLLDATRDPDPMVASEAANTLRYYPTRTVLRCLDELRLHADEKIRTQPEESFGDLRGSFLYRLTSRDHRVTRHIRAWLAPVWDILAFTDEELRPDEDGPYQPYEKECVQRSADEILALFADPDASPLVLNALHDSDWANLPPADRDRLRPGLLYHPDELVRSLAPECFAAWQDVESLLTLLHDASFGVRKSAMYRLGTLPPDPAIAEAAWQYLSSAVVPGVHGTETLNTFTRHAPRDVAVPRLVSIASDLERTECLRVAALDDLVNHRAAEELRGFLPLLLAEPLVTWSLHITLLNAIDELKLPAPDLSRLRAADNLDLQAALAPLLSRRKSAR
jgi:hypothetical protein